jgi:hypothetical protein
VGWEYEDKALDINGLGYLQRNDYVGTWGWWQYRTEKPLGPIHRTWHNINWWWGENTAGQRIQLGGNYNNSIQFKNLWWVGGGYSGDTPRWDDYEIADGPAVRHPRSYDWWCWAETDSRKRIYATANLSWGSYWEGGYWDYNAGVTFHPKTNIELALEPEYYVSFDVPRYVGDIPAEGDIPAGYLFAQQHSDRFSVTARGTATFTPNFSVQFYGEVFVADVHYDTYTRLIGPLQHEPAPELSLDGTDDDPDFSMLDFNANVVLRWEYRPGSTLFLVWTQARWFTFRRGADRLFDLGSENVFMVKLNYWWNL